jgi:hypothetical protein
VIVAFIVAAAAAHGCSKTERKFSEAEGDGGSNSGNEGDAGETGTPPPACETAGARRCNENVREICGPEGTWIVLPDSEQCGGANPVCTGAGVCAPYRLTNGTVGTLGELNRRTESPYSLREQTLLQNQKTCNSTRCVTGALQPGGG